MTRLTCPPFPPWCPSGKPQSRRPPVSSVRSSSCAAGCGWRCAGRQRPGQLPGPQPATRWARWREPCSTRPHSLSGNNTLRSTQASPGPLSPPRWGWDGEFKVEFLLSSRRKELIKGPILYPFPLSLFLPVKQPHDYLLSKKHSRSPETPYLVLCLQPHMFGRGQQHGGSQRAEWTPSWGSCH